ncbi:hypothetical protein [Candidatus Marithrix sp. Canyon 246]|uniref:hypothetical protein n=1 Tax=Candidatus Marithrix sp. Canyon 246 TaxID=1827136 RepID=UPI000849F37A|nr:hypothetical protein [Candidatus Marithrix sp. Canyon 246]
MAKIIKDEVRSKWQSLNLALECDEFNQIFKQLDNIAEPLKFDTTDEQWESWQNLIKQINNDIDNMNCHSKVRQRIFEEFQLIVTLIEEDQEPPSQAQLAKYLKIPKNTLNQDMKRLRKLLLQRPNTREI